MTAGETRRSKETADERIRMAELSKRSGVSVPTIKYYLREGLLMPGELSSPNQAGYGDEHVRRLRMIRALIEVGGLSVAAIGDVLDAVEGPELPRFELLGVVTGSLDKPQPLVDEGEEARARAAVDAAFRRRGWNLDFRASAIDTLVGVLVRMSELGYGSWASEALDTYLDAAEQVAEIDVEHALRISERAEVVDGAAVMTVLGEAALGAARRIAHIQVSARRLGHLAERES
ncbi:MerR family transcriptional regulator [Nocardia sp. CA-128927]|uniref:MerR family transcriptional regulator n=1 Tax=Nocardia sp. CA-128927 TaxID=3239975 RepID=UPI003D97B043